LRFGVFFISEEAGMLFLNKHRLFKFTSLTDLFLIFSLASLPSLAVASMTLTMQQAEQLALENDALTKSHNEYAQSYRQQSVASDQWPDPKIKLGFQALPTDSFELDQEPMTQLLVGYSQMIPRGDSLLYETELKLAQSDLKLADMSLRQRKVRLEVRKVWLSVYLQEASERIIKKNRQLFKQQLDVSQSLYSAGRKQQQDVLQAELELSLIDDKLQQISSMKNEARAQLARWIGDEASGYGLEPEENAFTEISSKNIKQLIGSVQKHPGVKKHTSKINANKKKVLLAEQKYKPQFGFEVSYGKRSGENIDGSDRADFLSGMVKFDIPVFTENKQDRILSSRKKLLQASRYEKQDKILFLKTKVKQLYVRLEKLKTRLYLYDDKVLSQARQNSRAALNGYQSGVVSFFTLTRARSAELKAELQRLKLYNQQSLAYAEMKFLVGEE
jgi:outer membrane protein TolC